MYGTLSFPPDQQQPTLESIGGPTPTEVELPNGDTKTINFRTTTWVLRSVRFIAHKAWYTPTGILRLQVAHIYS